MRYAMLSALVLGIPVSAAAAESGEGGFSFAASLVQMFGALAVVIGLIYLVTYLSRRWLKGGFGPVTRQSYIRVVETRHLAPKKSLLLVEVSGEYLLLSNGSEGISLIKQIDMLEEIEVIEPPREAGNPVLGRFQDKLDGIMSKMQTTRMMTLEPRN